MKKYLLILISLLLCLSIVSCSLLPFGKNGGDTLDTDESEQNESADGSESESSETEPTYISLYTGDKGAKIIYSDTADSKVISLATKLATSLKRMGIVEHNTTTSHGAHNADTVEIYLGSTPYPESQQVYDTLGYGEARGCVVGNKVVLGSFDLTGLEKSIELFLYAINDCKDEQGGLRISSSWSESIVTNETVAAIPLMTGKTPSAIVDSGNGSYTVGFKSLDRETFEGYITTLETEGFELYTVNKIEKNDFYTYFKDEQMIYAIYLDDIKVAKIMSAPRSCVQESLLKPDSSYVKGDKEMTLTQLGLTYAADHENDVGTKHPDASYYTSGMSYVMMLDDGSFIVIDGGYDKQGDADRIYETMKLQSGSETPTVAAWIFTHMHSDHVEVFPKFAKTYGDKVTVESFIFNRPGADQLGSHVDSWSDIRPSIEKYYKDTPVTKAVAGHKFYIRSAEIEILYSFDICQSALKNYNNASLVFTVKAEGKQIMILGDYSEGMPVMNKIYTAKTLKSDVVQVAHHGISDGSDALNRSIAAEYALWPVSALQIRTEWETNPYNIDLEKYAFNDYYMSMDQSKVFVAGDDVVVMTLTDDIATQTYDTFDAYLNGITK